MRRSMIVATLGVLFLCTSCAGGEASKEALIKAIDATVPFKDLAFFGLDGAALTMISQALGWLKYVAMLLCFVYMFSTLRWHQRGGDFQEYFDPISGPLRWLLLIGIVATALQVFQVSHEVAGALWPDKLEFGFWRESLGFKIPVLEGMPNGDANISTFIGTLATLPAVLGIHKGWEWILITLWVGSLLWAAFSGSLKPLVVWLIFWACWVAWGPLWYLELSLIGNFTGESNIVINTVRFTNLIYLITTWGSIVALFVGVPIIAAVTLPWPEAQTARSAAEKHSLRELVQTFGAFNALFPRSEGSGGQTRGSGNPGVESGDPVIYQEPSGRFPMLTAGHADNNTPPSDPNKNPPLGLLPAAGETGKGSNLGKDDGGPRPGGAPGRRGSGRSRNNRQGGSASTGDRSQGVSSKDGEGREMNLSHPTSQSQGDVEEGGDLLPTPTSGDVFAGQDHIAPPGSGESSDSETPAGSQDKAYYANNDFIVDGQLVLRKGERIYPDRQDQEGVVYRGVAIPRDLLEEGGEA